MSFVVEIPSVFTKPTQIPVRLGNTTLSGNESIQGSLQVNGSLTLNVGSNVNNSGIISYDSLDISNTLSVGGNSNLNDVSCNKVLVSTSIPTTINELTSKAYVDSQLLLSNVNIFSNASDVSSSIISDLSPNIWAVAGETVDRVSNASITITSGLATLENFYGKSVWSINGNQDIGNDPPILINAVIPKESTTYTISIAYATFQYSNTALFFQQPTNRDSGHANKIISYSAGSINIDEFTPSSGAVIFDIIYGIHTHNNAITIRRDSGTINLYFNGFLVNSKTVSEVYNGDDVDRIGLGGYKVQKTAGGSRIGGCAVWNRALSDSEVKLLTYDNITQTTDFDQLNQLGSLSNFYNGGVNFRAYSLSGSTINNGNNLIYDNESYDTEDSYDTATGVYTIVIGGTYLFTFGWYVVGGSTAVIDLIRSRAGVETIVQESTNGTQTNNNTSFVSTTITSCETGDLIFAKVISGTAKLNPFNLTAPTNYTSFSGSRISN